LARLRKSHKTSPGLVYAGLSSPGSVSKIECNAEVRGRGSAKVSLFRHLSPLTINAMMRVMPIHSRVNLQPAMVCLFTDIRTGVEKARTDFQRGDVAFMAAGGLICIFVAAAKSGRPLNPIGKVESGIELFDEVRLGDVVSLRAEIA